MFGRIAHKGYENDSDEDLCEPELLRRRLKRTDSHLAHQGHEAGHHSEHYNGGVFGPWLFSKVRGIVSIPSKQMAIELKVK